MEDPCDPEDAIDDDLLRAASFEDVRRTEGCASSGDPAGDRVQGMRRRTLTYDTGTEKEETYLILREIPRPSRTFPVTLPPSARVVKCVCVCVCVCVPVTLARPVRNRYPRSVFPR